MDVVILLMYNFVNENRSGEFPIGRLLSKNFTVAISQHSKIKL